MKQLGRGGSLVKEGSLPELAVAWSRPVSPRGGARRRLSRGTRLWAEQQIQRYESTGTVGQPWPSLRVVAAIGRRGARKGAPAPARMRHR